MTKAKVEVTFWLEYEPTDNQLADLVINALEHFGADTESVTVIENEEVGK